jgi:hypothetical protein
MSTLSIRAPTASTADSNPRRSRTAMPFGCKAKAAPTSDGRSARSTSVTPRRNPAKHQTRRQPTNSGSHHHRVVHSPNRRWIRRPRTGRSTSPEGSVRSCQRCGCCKTRSAKPSEHLDEGGLLEHRAFRAGRSLMRGTTMKGISMKGRLTNQARPSPLDIQVVAFCAREWR